MRRGMLLMCCMTASVVPSTADAKPGNLDRSFGKQGKAMAATAPQMGRFDEIGVGMAWAGRGRIVIAGSHTVLEYLPNGRLNRNFGDRGRLTIHSPPGIHFSLQAVATDSEGRTLVAGTSTPDSANSTPGPSFEFGGPPPSWATVVRFLSDGRRDTSFGNNGTFDSTFGLPPPVLAKGWPDSPFEYPSPLVKVTGLTVDPQDRPVLTGAFVEQITHCYPLFTSAFLDGSYVARLTASGSQDSGFNGNGLIQIAGFNYAGSPASVAEGLVYLTIQHTQCLRIGPEGPIALSAVDVDGHPDAGFGLSGSTALSEIEPLATTVSRTGAIYVTGPPPSVEYVEDPELHILRISPNGMVDNNFGHGGSALIPVGMTTSALAVDRRGRIILAGTASADPPEHSHFLLARMQPSGQIDRSFGNGGMASTGFGKKTFAEPAQILVDPRNRILVGGVVYSSPRLATGSGVVLARYLNGNRTPTGLTSHLAAALRPPASAGGLPSPVPRRGGAAWGRRSRPRPAAPYASARLAPGP